MKPSYPLIYHRSSYAFLCLLFALLFSCNNEKTVELHFAFGPDDSGALAAMIDKFNQQHEGEIVVNFKESARLSNEFYREIEKDFAADAPSMDVIGADVVWTSAFAKAGWVEDISNKFYDHYQTKDFVESSLNSTIYQNKIWGIPWFTDAGILYYRKDLLAQSGFSEAPKTWEELRQMAKKVTADHKIDHGFVFQGANYEGGVTNACEYIWNSGGKILISDLSAGLSPDQSAEDVNIITVNSGEAVNGLSDAYRMVTEGVAPANIHTYKELDALNDFQNNKAVFMRAWPTVYGQFLLDDSPVKTDQVGLAALPVSSLGVKSRSCLGGWNLMINTRIDEEKKAAAWTFIQYMTQEAQQRYLAETAGNLPSLQSLYADADLKKKVPALAFANTVIPNTRVRPVTPLYMEISPDMAWTFSEMLKGNLTPSEAVETIHQQFESLLAVRE